MSLPSFYQLSTPYTFLIFAWNGISWSRKGQKGQASFSLTEIKHIRIFQCLSLTYIHTLTRKENNIWMLRIMTLMGTTATVSKLAILWQFIPAENVSPLMCCAFWLCVVSLNSVVNTLALTDTIMDIGSSPMVKVMRFASNNSTVKVHSSEIPPVEHFTTGYIYGLRTG